MVVLEVKAKPGAEGFEGVEPEAGPEGEQGGEAHERHGEEGEREGGEAEEGAAQAEATPGDVEG